MVLGISCLENQVNTKLFSKSSLLALLILESDPNHDLHLLSASVLLFVVVVAIILVVVLRDLLVLGHDGRGERVEHQRWRRQRGCVNSLPG